MKSHEVTNATPEQKAALRAGGDRARQALKEMSTPKHVEGAAPKNKKVNVPMTK